MKRFEVPFDFINTISICTFEIELKLDAKALE